MLVLCLFCVELDESRKGCLFTLSVANFGLLISVEYFIGFNTLRFLCESDIKVRNENRKYRAKYHILSEKIYFTIK